MPERRDPSQLTTVEQHFIEEEHQAHHSTGELTKLLTSITLAVKTIAHEIRQAGLTDIIGNTDTANSSGDAQQRLDVYSNEVMKKVLSRSGTLAALASEEEPKPVHMKGKYKVGKYLVFFDPLDGSSNIDVNASVGTTFSIYKRKSRQGKVTNTDLLRRGREQVAAGYALYGSSTMIVYTSGHGTHGFTFAPDLGEFLLSHPNIRMPKNGKYYSINEANTNLCDDGTCSYIDYIKTIPKKKRPSLRYIGTMVADVHRTLLKGGIFMYPRAYDDKAFKPKLRLLYEVSPMAMLIEQAGGLAVTDGQRSLDVLPEEIHQKIPFVCGSSGDVKKYLQHQKKHHK